MKLPAAILIVALTLLVASLQMQPFTTASDGGDWLSSVPQGDSEAYHEARAKALTPKYQLQDYGVTLIFVAVAFALLGRKGGLSAPATSLGFALVAFAAPLLTTVGFIFDLLQGYERLEFPPWADSLGIPLAGVPVVAVALLVWSFAHFVFLSGVEKRSNVRLSLVALRDGNKWLLFVAGATALLLLVSVAGGAYDMAVPCAVWLYYYVSILSVRGTRGG